MSDTPIKIINAPPLVPSPLEIKESVASTTLFGGITVTRKVPVESPPSNTATSGFRAPTVSINTGSFSNFLKAPDVPNPKIDLGTFGIKAPTLPKGAIAAAVMNPSSLKNINVKEIGKSMGVPTSVKSALARAGTALLPPVDKALKTLGIPTNIQGIVKITGLQFPKFPNFPGLDLIGINLGAGPKWIAEQLAKYKLIVLPFVPGLKINMGMALAAVSVIRALLTTSPSELLKHLLNSIVDDLKTQVADQIQKAVDTVTDDFNKQLKGITDSAKIEVTKQNDRENPPRTETDENGETKTIPSPPADLSGIPDFKDVKIASTTERIDVNTLREAPLPGSELKAFNFSQSNTNSSIRFDSTLPSAGTLNISNSSTINPSSFIAGSPISNAQVRGVPVGITTNTTPPPIT